MRKVLEGHQALHVPRSASLVPVGPNDYGHPAPDLMDELARRGMAVLRTDEQGTIALDGEVAWSQQ